MERRAGEVEGKMKQRITIEQLRELSDTELAKLKEWWEPMNGDAYTNSEGYEVGGGENCVFFIDEIEGNRIVYGDYICVWNIEEVDPLLSIGQMIEFLGDNEALESDFNGSTVIRTDTCPPEYNYTSICDALWEVVKKVLKEEPKRVPDEISTIVELIEWFKKNKPTSPVKIGPDCRLTRISEFNGDSGKRWYSFNDIPIIYK